MTDADRIAQLEEEVAYLRSELGDVLDATTLDDLRRRLRVDPTNAKILLRLYLAGGRVVPTFQLLDYIREETPLNGLRVHISRIRRRLGLGPGAIVNVYGEGYRLAPPAMALMHQALQAEQPRAT